MQVLVFIVGDWQTRTVVPTLHLPSPIEATVDLLADAWTTLLIREAFFGARRFDHFIERLTIPRARLSERLRRLVEVAIFTRVPYQQNPPRFEYRLTERGLDVFPFAVAMKDWGERWLERGTIPPLALEHRVCGQPLQLSLQRAYGRTPLEPETIRWPRTASVHPDRRAARWRRFHIIVGKAWNDAVMLAVVRIGDPWSILLIREALAGAEKFSDFLTLGIATNTLTARLQHLTQVGIFERAAPTSGYGLTPAGRELSTALLMLRAWGEKWLASPVEGWAVLRDARGQRVRPRPVCSACQRPIDAREVTYVRG